MTNCPKCQEALDPKFNFCPICGQKVTRFPIVPSPEYEYCTIDLSYVHPRNFATRLLGENDLVFQAQSEVDGQKICLAKSRLLFSKPRFFTANPERYDFEGDFELGNVHFTSRAYRWHLDFLKELKKDGWEAYEGGKCWYNSHLRRRK